MTSAGRRSAYAGRGRISDPRRSPVAPDGGTPARHSLHTRASVEFCGRYRRSGSSGSSSLVVVGSSSATRSCPRIGSAPTGSRHWRALRPGSPPPTSGGNASALIGVSAARRQVRGDCRSRERATISRPFRHRATFACARQLVVTQLRLRAVRRVSLRAGWAVPRPVHRRARRGRRRRGG
jgi:hypothetical protein